MKKEYYKSVIKCENFIYDPGNMNIYREIVGMRLPLDRGKKRSFAEHSVRMGWRGNLAISNLPLRRKNFSLLVNPIRFQGEVIINY